MTIDTMTSLISSVGFPIACVLGLAWFLWQMWKKQQADNEKQVETLMKQNEAREERYSKQIDKFNDTLQNFNTTLIRIDARLENVEKVLK